MERFGEDGGLGDGATAACKSDEQEEKTEEKGCFAGCDACTSTARALVPPTCVVLVFCISCLGAACFFLSAVCGVVLLGVGVVLGVGRKFGVVFGVCVFGVCVFGVCVFGVCVFCAGIFGCGGFVALCVSIKDDAGSA